MSLTRKHQAVFSPCRNLLENYFGTRKWQLTERAWPLPLQLHIASFRVHPTCAPATTKSRLNVRCGHGGMPHESLCDIRIHGGEIIWEKKLASEPGIFSMPLEKEFATQDQDTGFTWGPGTILGAAIVAPQAIHIRKNMVNFPEGFVGCESLSLASSAVSVGDFNRFSFWNSVQTQS